MTQEFKEDTVNIILNEMFNEGRKTLSQSEFDAITKKYAARIVKLFAIPDVSEQRELLFAFDEYWNKNNCDGENFCDVVDRFLANNSC
jgi:hypothetical protein